MKVAEADILMVAGWLGSGEDHWQSRWERSLSTARRVQQDDWEHPDRDLWVARLVEAVEACKRPVVLVAHSLGVANVVQAAPHLPAGRVKGAFLVAMADPDEPPLADAAKGFSPLSHDPLPFPSILVVSRTDPYCAHEVADTMGHAWGSLVIDAGDAGHITSESGHGPWPEGSMTFARFMSRL